MSKYYQGYLGAQQGKLGNAVGRRWKGRDVMAVYQPQVHDPRTTAQQIVRARFGRLGQLSGYLREALLIGMGYVAQQYRLTEGNQFVKRNWNNVTALTPDDVSVNYSALRLSEGSLPEAAFGAVDYGTGTHLHIEAPLSGGSDQPGASVNDQVYLVAICPDRSQAVVGSPSLRSAEKVSVNVPASWDGMEVHVYGFAISALTSQKKQCSTTTYLGNGEVA